MTESQLPPSSGVVRPKSSFAQDRALRNLMESFVGRLPEDHRVSSVRLVLQELWSKAARYLDKVLLRLTLV